jgi:alpha-glucosidase
MADTLRFWLKRGVDGFRVDASAVLAEDDLLRDDPPNLEADDATPPPQRLKRIFTDDRRESVAYIEEMRAVLDEFGDRLLCGEVQGKTDRIGHFYGEPDCPRFHLPLNFALLDTPWDSLSLQANIDAYLNAIPGHAWPDWVIGGHDKNRVASRIGQAQARILAMLLLTPKGTPFFYAGDELGMEQVRIPPDRRRSLRKAGGRLWAEPRSRTLADALECRPQRRLQHGRAMAADPGRRGLALGHPHSRWPHRSSQT